MVRFKLKPCVFCGDRYEPKYHADLFCSIVCYFASKLDTLPDSYDVCWVWNGACVSDGYGTANVGGKQIRAHRLSYKTFVGEIPNGLVVRHTCDNPPCINPQHLLVGTTRDNVQDRTDRNRGSRAGNGGHIQPKKLSIEQAIEIYNSTGSGVLIGAKFGVSKNMVYNIRRGMSWGSITRQESR